MVTNINYTFSVSISTESYINKEISGAMIGSTKDENNRIIRKNYGYSANKGIGYSECTVTSNELLDKLTNGHVFCHLFNPTSVRKDGTFGSSQKKDDNFSGSYCIGVDIDDTNYTSIESYINALELKPTLWYSSYSNSDTKVKFRMIYVFDEKIEGKYYFRYCAYQLNQKLQHDTNEVITDDCNLRCSQYFNGTNKSNTDLKVEYGLTNIIYSLSDFNITNEGYINFLKNDCYYKSKNKERNKDINNILNQLSSIISISSTTYYNELQKCGHQVIEENEVINNESFTQPDNELSKVDSNLVNDMTRLDYEEFMKYNRHKYIYFYRQEKTEWIDNLYQFIDKDFFSLYYNVTTVKDGSKRRKKVFERMCLRRVLNPSIDINTIIFNAYEDIHRFFNNDDNVLNADYIVRNAERAFELEISDIESMYSDNIEYLKSKAPKSGIILKRHAGKLAERNTYLKAIRYNLIDDYYNINCSVQENLDVINEYLFPISEKTLYNYCKDRNINTKMSKERSDEEIMKYYDSTLSIRKNVDRLNEMGISISKSKLSKLIKEYNNISISSSNVTFSTTYYNDLQFCGQSISDNYEVIINEISESVEMTSNIDYTELENEGLSLFNQYYTNYNNYYY